MASHRQHVCCCHNFGHIKQHTKSDHDPENESIIEDMLFELDYLIENDWPLNWEEEERKRPREGQHQRFREYMEVLQERLQEEERRNAEELDEQSNDPDDETDERLRRYSNESLVSTASNFAHAQMVAQVKMGQSRAFHHVGAGNSGIVFSGEGRSVVYKVARNDPAQLSNDHNMHVRILRAFEDWEPPGMRIPGVHQFVERHDSSFFDCHPELASQAKAYRCSIPTTVIISDRILPLPETMRHTLIDKYCHEKGKESAFNSPHNEDCLARVYLGKERSAVDNTPAASTRPRFFTLRNFPMYRSRMSEMGFDCAKVAQSMGRIVAILHWVANVDGRDVEFVLGSSSDKDPDYHFATTEFQEDFHHRRIELWMIDFNQVQEISLNDDGIDQALRAWNDNDPYFPKPKPVFGMDYLWDVFMAAYLRYSSEMLRRKSVAVRLLPFVLMHKLRSTSSGRFGLLDELYQFLNMDWKEKYGALGTWMMPPEWHAQPSPEFPLVLPKSA